MENTDLNPRNVQIVLDRFKAGVPPHEILRALHDAGNRDVTLEIIQKCLLQNAHTMFDPVIVPAITSNAGPSSQAQNRSHHGESLPPLYSWNAVADTFALCAHNYGLSVPQIAAQLCKNGYDVSQNEVAESLTRQGVQNVR